MSANRKPLSIAWGLREPQRSRSRSRSPVPSPTHSAGFSAGDEREGDDLEREESKPEAADHQYDPGREEFAAFIAAGGELNVPPAPCRQGCGRPSAKGYRTCCRTCIQTCGKTHEPQCEQAHKERREAMESLRSWGQRACAHCGDAMTPTV